MNRNARFLLVSALAAAGSAPAWAEPPAEAVVMWDGAPSLGGAWIAHPDHDGPGAPLVTLTTEDGTRTEARLVRRGGDARGYLLAAETARALGLEPGEPARLTVTRVELAEDAAADEVAADLEDAPDGEDPGETAAVAAEAAATHLSVYRTESAGAAPSSEHPLAAGGTACQGQASSARSASAARRRLCSTS